MIISHTYIYDFQLFIKLKCENNILNIFIICNQMLHLSNQRKRCKKN